MKNQYMNVSSLLAVGVSSLVLVSSGAYAGAYQLHREYNAVEIGNSGSGGAGLAEDASTAYANPGGLMRLKKPQVVVSGDGVFSHAKFKGTNTLTNVGSGAVFTQTGSASSNVSSLVPALYFSTPFNPSWLPRNRVSLALGVNAPFGLSTRYPNDSIIRYSATISKLSTVDISPNLAFRFNKHFSGGIGLDVDQISVDLRRVVGLALTAPTNDSYGKNVADGTGYGAHAGLLYEVNEQSRVGLAYHSRVSTTVTGDSTLNGSIMTVTTGGVFTGTEITSDLLRTKIILPPSTVFSGFHDFDNGWTINGTASYTEWSVLGAQLVAYNLAGLPPTTLISASIEQHYRNTWLLALGGTYRVNDRWTIRGGASYDQSPVKGAYRNVTLPDANKIGLSVGAHYAANKQLSVDAGYMHLFSQEVNVSAPMVLGSQTSVSNGKYDESFADLIGLQVNYDFC